MKVVKFPKQNFIFNINFANNKFGKDHRRVGLTAQLSATDKFPSGVYQKN